MSIDGHSSAPGASIHVNHWCEHPGCSEWGGWGFSAGKAAPINWYCFEHFPNKRPEQVALIEELKARDK